MIESVLDLNSNNIWNVSEHQIAKLWEEDRKDESFRQCEDKMLNIIRLAYEVVHYNVQDEREVVKYENGEWAILSHVDAKRGNVALRRRQIRRITDLSYENIKHITAATLLELIDRNFGGGWDAIPLSIKDIIESGFDISTSTLPAYRMHAEGGTLEKKVAAGFEVLEVAKGTWTEAIFAKKKEPMEKLRMDMSRYDEDGNLIPRDEDEDPEDDNDGDTDEEVNDDTFYSSYAAEAEVKEEDEELSGLAQD